MTQGFEVMLVYCIANNSLSLQRAETYGKAI